MKNQCSRDYFYGSDLELEKALGHIEGHYARVLKKLVQQQDIDERDQDWLRLFTVVQTRRTERAISELARWQQAFAGEAFKRNPEQQPPPLTHQQLVTMSMSAGLEMHDHTRDLKFIVLRNKTPIEFITSDDPAVLTNKYHFENSLFGGFGVINSGAILLLPLTPKLTALFFDIGIYSISIPRGTRFVDVTSSIDVTVLNQIQCINAHKNLYFLTWDGRNEVANSALSAAKLRGGQNFEIETLVRDSSLPGEAFRKGSDSEEQESTHVLIRTSHTPSRPTSWPSFIKYRPKPVAFSNGTAIGFVRKKEWLSSDAARR